MICFVCDGQGRKTDAVAICVVCGMALCKDHCVREEIPVWETLHTGMGEARRELPEKLPRLLCSECYRALHQAR